MSSTQGPRPASAVTHPGGMRSLRAFPDAERTHLDPFVVFERFHIEPGQGFDTHPHSGFEIVSYMLEGGMAHDDSLGEASVARAGDAMRITTGRGYEHSELPANDKYCSGLQLWVNLPRAAKETAPSFEEVTAAELPVSEESGAAVTTVVGEGSPIDLQTPVTYLDVDISDSWSWHVPAGWNGFCYAVSGSGSVDGERIQEAQYVLLEDGGELELTTENGLHVAAVAGRPHGEPIRQRGPFVE